jgi:Na+/melibiose symporter-like transporter
MITFSGILGQVIPSLFFRGYSHEHDDDGYQEGKHKFKMLLLFEALLVVIFLVPNLFIMRSNPPTPPSHFANKTTKLNFKDSLHALFTDRKFVTL